MCRPWGPKHPVQCVCHVCGSMHTLHPPVGGGLSIVCVVPSSWLAACGLGRYLQVLLESAEFQKSIVFIQGSPLITKVT
jgi:hypothetical protein